MGNDNKDKFNNSIIDDLGACIESFCDTHNIEDLTKESQNIWCACMMYCNKCLYADKSKLKYKPLYDNTIMPTNHGIYNYDLLYNIIDLMLYYATLYDKEVSIYTFSLLSGIELDTIYSWSNKNKSIDKLTYKPIDLYKKLVNANEQTLANITISGKRNPVGAITKLNSKFGWNGLNGSNSGMIEAQPITELPKLGNIAQKQIEQ